MPNTHSKQKKERMREISLAMQELENEYRTLDTSIRKAEYRKRKQEFDNAVCKCGHKRKYHGKSMSVNYTGGTCDKCECFHFIMK